jgi:hypothetical protein
MQSLPRTQLESADARSKLPKLTYLCDVVRRAMIENFRGHPYTRSVCLETARLFEQRAAKHLVEAQEWADQGIRNSALELQTKARVAQQRAHAWHLRAKNASGCGWRGSAGEVLGGSIASSSDILKSERTGTELMTTHEQE